MEKPRLETNDLREMQHIARQWTNLERLLLAARVRLEKMPAKQLLRAYPEGVGMKHQCLKEAVTAGLDVITRGEFRMLGDIMR